MILFQALCYVKAIGGFRRGIAPARAGGFGHGKPYAVGVSGGVGAAAPAAPVAAISTAAICAASCAPPDLATRLGSVFFKILYMEKM